MKRSDAWLIRVLVLSFLLSGLSNMLVRLETQIQSLLDAGFQRDDLVVVQMHDGPAMVEVCPGIERDDTREYVDRLKADCGVAKSRYDKCLKIAQEQCKHNWEKKKTWDDHDGWSRMTVTYYEFRQCKMCDKQETVKTGKGPGYV